MYTKFTIVLRNENTGTYDTCSCAVDLDILPVVNFMATKLEERGVTLVKLYDGEYLTVDMPFKKFDKFLEEEMKKYPKREEEDESEPEGDS